jgi:hypothetical protein
MVFSSQSGEGLRELMEVCWSVIAPRPAEETEA